MRANPARRAPPLPEVVPPDATPPSPESVFLAWLLWLPPERTLRAAARDELARIDRQPAPLPTGARRLRAMFVALMATLPEAATDPVPLTDRSTSR